MKRRATLGWTAASLLLCVAMVGCWM